MKTKLAYLLIALCLFLSGFAAGHVYLETFDEALRLHRELSASNAYTGCVMTFKNGVYTVKSPAGMRWLYLDEQGAVEGLVYDCQ